VGDPPYYDHLPQRREGAKTFAIDYSTGFFCAFAPLRQEVVNQEFPERGSGKSVILGRVS
jgi:hypothetical protein